MCYIYSGSGYDWDVSSSNTFHNLLLFLFFLQGVGAAAHTFSPGKYPAGVLSSELGLKIVIPSKHFHRALSSPAIASRLFDFTN